MNKDNIQDSRNEGLDDVKRNIYESGSRDTENAQRQEVDNLMRKLETLCKAFQDQQDGQNDANSSIEQILSIAEFVHQEYSELVKQNEDLQNQIKEIAAENEKLVPMITELEEQDSTWESKIQTLNDEVSDKESIIMELQQQVNELKVANKELVAVSSKNKRGPASQQIVLLQTDDRLVRKEQQHQKQIQAIEDTKTELQKKVDEQAGEITRLDDVHQTTKDDLKKYSALVKDLEEKLEFKDQQMAQLNTKIQHLSEEIDLKNQEQQQYELRMEQVLQMLKNDESSNNNASVLQSRNDLKSFVEIQKQYKAIHRKSSKNFDQLTCRYSDIYKLQESQSEQEVCVQSIDDQGSLMSYNKAMMQLQGNFTMTPRMEQKDSQDQSLIDFELSAEKTPNNIKVVDVNITKKQLQKQSSQVNSGEMVLQSSSLAKLKQRPKTKSSGNLLHQSVEILEPSIIEQRAEEEASGDSMSQSDKDSLSSKSDQIGSSQIQPKSQKSEQKAFFEMVVKTTLLNQPKGFVREIDTEKMFKRAIDQKVEWHQFIEWVDHDIHMQIFKGLDALFDQAEKRQQHHAEMIKINEQYKDIVIIQHDKSYIDYEDPSDDYGLTRDNSMFGVLCCGEPIDCNNPAPQNINGLPPRSFQKNKNNCPSGRVNKMKKINSNMNFRNNNSSSAYLSD